MLVLAFTSRVVLTENIRRVEIGRWYHVTCNGVTQGIPYLRLATEPCWASHMTRICENKEAEFSTRNICFVFALYGVVIF